MVADLVGDLWYLLLNNRMSLGLGAGVWFLLVSDLPSTDGHQARDDVLTCECRGSSETALFGFWDVHINKYDVGHAFHDLFH